MRYLKQISIYWYLKNMQEIEKISLNTLKLRGLVLLKTLTKGTSTRNLIQPT